MMFRIRTLSVVAALLALGAGAALFLSPPEPATAPNDLALSGSAPAAGHPLLADRPAHGTPPAAPATVEEVTDELAAWRDLHAPQGRLSMDATRALIAERDAAAESLADAIGRLAAGDVGEALAAWHDADAVRDRLVIIDGLGRNHSPEAIAALEEVYDADAGYTSRSRVLRALGDSPADGREALLEDTMWDAADERLSQLAAQALYGESGASQTLIDAVTGALPINTRLEAIHSLGAIGSPDARAALSRFAGDPALEQRVRQYAQRELERSLGG